MIKSLLCLGDSLTAGYGGPYSQCWTRLLARRTGIMINNQGICGDTLIGMRFRLNGALASKPEACLLIGGTNDIFLGGVPDRQAVTDIVDICRDKGVIPLLGTPVPLDYLNMTAQWSSCVDAFSQGKLEGYITWLREFADKENIPLADLYAGLLAAEDFHSLYVDGVHMSPRGNEIIADIVEKMLAK